MSLRNKWNNLSIRLKFAVGISVIMCITLFITTIAIMFIVTKKYSAQITFSQEQSMRQAEEYINDRVENIYYLLDQVNMNSNVIKILQRANENKDHVNDIYQEYSDIQEIQNLLTPMREMTDISLLRIYVEDWLTYARQGGNFMPYSSMEKDKAVAEAINNKQYGKVWREPFVERIPPGLYEDKYISVVQLIRDPDHLSQIIGAVEVGVKLKVIEGILRNANITQSGVVFLMNRDGMLLASSDKTKKYESYKNKIFEKIKLKGNSVINLENQRYILMEATIDSPDWSLIAVIPESETKAPANTLRNMMFVVLVIMLIVATLSCFFISDKLTRRITKLAMRMNDISLYVKNEEPEQTRDMVDDSKNQDEIGELYQSFIGMITELRIMREEVFHSGIKLKEMEMRALIAQINPHFLYNTLELINWEAMDGNTQKIINISTALSVFYRTCLSKGEDIIRIHDELRNIEAYVQIQNYRFGGNVKLSIEVNDAIQHNKIPKLTLQPLVENAILHGFIRDGEHVEGEVLIKGVEGNDDILLFVHDNGIGMTQDQINTFMTGKKFNGGESNGYGINNINSRLKLLYGIEYELKFLSNQSGTTVIVKLPKEVK